MRPKSGYGILWRAQFAGAFVWFFVVIHSPCADHRIAQQWVDEGNRSYFFFNWYDGGISTNRSEYYYSQAIAHDPSWAVPYNNRGLARYRLFNFVGADADFNQAKSLDPSYLAPYLNKSKSLVAQKRFDEALGELLEAIVRAKPTASVYYNLGWIYDEKGDYSLAVQHYAKALELDPNHSKARLALGVSRAKAGETAAAREDFYGLLTTLTNFDLCRGLASYNLHVLKSPGLSISNPSQADFFREGLFYLSTAQYGRALEQLGQASQFSNRYPEIALASAWAFPDYRQGRRVMEESADLFQHYNIYVRTASSELYTSNAQVWVDGMPRAPIASAWSPAKLRYIFPHSDLAIQHRGKTNTKEWHGALAHYHRPGTTNVLIFGLSPVEHFSPLRPVIDLDQNGLADDWERLYFSTSGQDPAKDQDADGLTNLEEYHWNTHPLKADTDGDSSGDFDERFARTNPADAGSVVRIIDVKQDDQLGVTIIFTMAQMALFTLESCHDLTDDSWIEFFFRYASSAVNYRTFPAPSHNLPTYYRIRVAGFLDEEVRTFILANVINLGAIVDQLKHHPDAATAYIWERLSERNRQRVLNFAGEAGQQDLVKNALVRELNRLVTGPSLYALNAFRTAPLSVQSLKMAESPQPPPPINLNRSILVDVFAGALSYY